MLFCSYVVAYLSVFTVSASQGYHSICYYPAYWFSPPPPHRMFPLIQAVNPPLSRALKKHSIVLRLAVLRFVLVRIKSLKLKVILNPASTTPTLTPPTNSSSYVLCEALWSSNGSRRSRVAGRESACSYTWLSVHHSRKCQEGTLGIVPWGSFTDLRFDL